MPTEFICSPRPAYDYFRQRSDIKGSSTGVPPVFFPGRLAHSRYSRFNCIHEYPDCRWRRDQYPVKTRSSTVRRGVSPMCFSGRLAHLFCSSTGVPPVYFLFCSSSRIVCRYGFLLSPLSFNQKVASLQPHFPFVFYFFDFRQWNRVNRPESYKICNIILFPMRKISLRGFKTVREIKTHKILSRFPGRPARPRSSTGVSPVYFPGRPARFFRIIPRTNR